MQKRELLLLDGVGNMLLGVILLGFPIRLTSWLGIPDVTSRFYPSLIDLARGRRRSAGALGDVLVNLAILERTGAEPLYRGVDHAWVQLLNFLPWKSHTIDRTGSEVLDHHVTLFDPFGEDFVARFFDCCGNASRELQGRGDRQQYYQASGH